MTTQAPKKPLIEATELDVGNLKFEPATQSAANALELMKELAADSETIKFNVFNSKFIGILEVYLNGCGGWRFTEFKDEDDGRQVLIQIDSALPSVQSKNTKEILRGVAKLTSRAHNNIDRTDKRWREGRKRLEYINTEDLQKKIKPKKTGSIVHGPYVLAKKTRV